MKKVLAILLALVMVLAIVGCSSEKEDTTEEARPVAYFCISHMSNAWAVTASETMEAAAKEAGVDLTVVSADQDINKQVSQIEMAVTAKATAIIIEPVSAEGVLAAVESAEAAGIPCIIYNQNISDPSKATTFVGVSNADMGYMEMKRACEDMGGKGNVAILLGPRGSEGQLGRSEGYTKALAEYPDVKVVFEEEAAWTTEDALKLAENWLSTGTEINAFVSQNDNMALGAIKAVEDIGKDGEIKAYGVDAVDDALKAIKEGRLEISVDQATGAQSKAAIDCVLKLAKGEKLEDQYLVEAVIIDASNVDQYLN
ncbi:MAG: sugar ABC transporter substrate-binding protein [Faecousia sp.]